MAEKDRGEQMHVLDANVFIHGAEMQLSKEFPNPITVPAVTQELESRESGRRFDVERISVFEPSEEAIKTVSETVEEVGEPLSETDQKVVALALEKNAVIVSDDYGVQNIAAFLDVEYTPFLKEGISEKIRWQYKCVQCGETISETVEECPVCGGDVKRVAKK